MVDCYFNAASYDFSVNYGKIIRSSAYAARIDLSASEGEIELIVTGKEYLQNEGVYDLQLNTTGETKKWSNALISTQDHAKLIADIEYDVSYRGDLRPDAGDIIFLQGRKTDRMQVFLEEHSLSFNGGALSGSVTARRAIDGVGATENELGRRN